MEQYPELDLLVDGYDKRILSGRRLSRDLDGSPRVQGLWSRDQYEITVTHPNLNKAQVAELLDFWRRNMVLEFEFHNPEDEQDYIMMFFSDPTLDDYNVTKQNVSFTLAGYLKNG